MDKRCVGPVVAGKVDIRESPTENLRRIAEALGRELGVVRTSVHRPNLRYDVERAENGEERLRALLRRTSNGGNETLRGVAARLLRGLGASSVPR